MLCLISFLYSIFLSITILLGGSSYYNSTLPQVSPNAELVTTLDTNLTAKLPPNFAFYRGNRAPYCSAESTPIEMRCFNSHNKKTCSDEWKVHASRKTCGALTGGLGNVHSCKCDGAPWQVNYSYHMREDWVAYMDAEIYGPVGDCNRVNYKTYNL